MRTAALSLAAAAMAFAGFASPAAGSPSVVGEWPQWRGPDRNGLSGEKGLLQEWPKDGPTLIWKAHGLGAGYSGITISGGRLFTMGDLDGSSQVLALDMQGKVLWSTKVGKPGAPGWGGFAGPRASVTVDGELAYAVDQWGDLVCVESASGKERWRKNYGQDFGAKRPEWGFSGSPLADGERLVIAPGGPRGTVVALDRKTGKVLWESKGFSEPVQYGSVIPAEIGGVRQYLLLTMDSLAAVAPEGGEVLWKTRRKGSTAVIPDPIISGDLVYVTSGYGSGCNLFKVTGEGGKLKVEQVYATKDMVNHHGGVVRVGDHLYGYSDGKGWVCQDLRTGKTVWREKEKLPKGSITFADGRLYLRAEEGPGTVAIIDASPEGWKERGRFDQPDRTDRNSWTHPVIAGGRLYIRDQDLLLAYDIKSR